ncbi:uncharacterized protein UBRO_06895 [Ustilago bromivora]|uniref:BZIP domain-containing protein n=1 Tax=Ustilago bromivora TaxID=307758 RepID=A0A1K0G912_9BASI|nr:uncharacterized protein UBRO_06895 [Ustilago bromivora]SYW80799.1 uncharacterized protein UBRO2_04013 [Ustilago bromivora]
MTNNSPSFSSPSFSSPSFSSPSFSSPPSAQTISAPSSSPHAPSWPPTDASHHIGMSRNFVDPHFSAEHASSAGFRPMLTGNLSGPFVPNARMSALANSANSASMLVQPGMYGAQHLNTFWKPSPSSHMIKMESGTDLFAPNMPSDFSSFPDSQPMVSSMSLPTYATHALDSRFTMSDAESLCSVPSPSSTSEASSRPASVKRKAITDASLDATSAVGTDDAKANKKFSRQSGQRRPPPSASHVTESGKPFPVIDTSAKHSSLFVPPDTSGLTKREARLVKNRAAAFLSRQRKREQFEEMQIKCKAISMLVWRMWETIAGPDAGSELIESTPLASLLANQDPAARLCLEEVISKKGASIAPTADEAEGTPAPESQPMRPASTGPASTTQKEGDNTSAELERTRSDLAACLQRESGLLSQLDALRASAAAMPVNMPVNNMPVNNMPVAGMNDSQNWNNAGMDASNMSVPSMAFRGIQGAELPLFMPESPLSKFTLGDATNAGMLLDASHAGFDLSKTPTLAMFSENALRNRSAQQQLGNYKASGSGMGLGLGYRFPCASAPSSPSTASSSSTESSQSRHHGLMVASNKNSSSNGNGNGKAPSTLASALLLAGMPLMDVGPTANELAADEKLCCSAAAAGRKDVRAARRVNSKAKAVARASACAVARNNNAGQPSSHLSDDDLLMEMGLDSASFSEAEDDEHVDIKPCTSTSNLQSATWASTISCA